MPKIQDIIFIIFLAFLLYKRNPTFFVWAALFCIALSIPFFFFWVFFTAQRLIYYAFFLLVIALLLFIFKKRYHK